MSDGITKFKADLAKLAENLDIAIGVVTMRATLGIFNGIVQRTPVDTGRARASWAVSVAEPSTLYIEPVPKAKKGESQEVLPPPEFPAELEIDGTQKVYIVNNLPYIEPLENGHSKQAPNGMVKLALIDAEAEIEPYLK